MSASEFDLDDPPPIIDETPAQRRRRERQSKITDSGSGGKKSSGSSGGSKADGDLLSSLIEGFGNLADRLRDHDPELAEAFDQDKEAISKGLVSLTRTVKWLRKPLTLFVGFLQPVLAFWHVGSLLLKRVFIFRENVFASREQAGMTPEEWEQSQQPGTPVMPNA